jgi:parvulin-like peptidyl-prolyl isomerase
MRPFKADKIQIVAMALSLLPLAGCSMQVPDSLKTLPFQSEQQMQENILAINKASKAGLLDKVNEPFTICSINDVPITIGEYKRQLKTQQQHLQADLAVNPEAKAKLLAIASQRNITLSEEEKKEFLEKSHALQKTGKSFRKFLADNNASQQDFDAQVLEVGLATKTSKEILADNLMRELINRELLCQGAKANGLTKQAYSRYTQVKGSPQMQKLVEISGLTPDDVRKELLKNELCNLMIKKLESEAPVTEDDERKLYEENKAKLQHGPRVRLSQILIKAPVADRGPIEGLRTQLKRANPKWSDSDLDKAVQVTVESQRQKAMNLLVRAKEGADFYQLANDNTEDIPARNAKNGGDLGFQEQSRLKLLENIDSLQVGQVVPELITTAMGFHIIKVTGKEGPGVISFDECQDKIKQILEEQKPRMAVEQWLQEQRKKARIVLSAEMQDLVSQAAKQASNPTSASDSAAKTTN